MINSMELKDRNFLSILDLSKHQIIEILNRSIAFKKKDLSINLKNKVLGLIFDKASTRTRVSFQVAMTRLGGTTIDLNPNTSQIGRGEPIRDTARVLSSYCDILAIRTYYHKDLIEYARWSSKPVINALTEIEHPCQALADFITIKEEFGYLKNLNLAYIGDGNNVANSLMLCGSLLGVNIKIACPEGYEPSNELMKKHFAMNKDCGGISITNDPYEAVENSNIIYTDVWSSMGQEAESANKDSYFKKYTLNEELVSASNSNSIVLHCLPAYRGKEITNEVMESSKSRIFQQAENRLFAQQSLLSYLLEK